MTKIDEAEIEFLAKDLVSKIITKIDSNINKLDKNTKKSSENMSKSFVSLARILETSLGFSLSSVVNKALGFFVDQAKVAIKESLRMEQAFSVLNQQTENASQLMNKLRTSTKGLVSDYTLLNGATRALSFGIQEDAIPALAETATALGKIQGISTEQAFNDIITGLARASPLILDNLGIILDSERAYREYAESIESSVEELTKQEKMLALQNNILKNNRYLVVRNSLAIETTQERLDRWTTSLKNSRNAIAESIIEQENQNRILRQTRTLAQELYYEQFNLVGLSGEIRSAAYDQQKQQMELNGTLKTEQDLYEELLNSGRDFDQLQREAVESVNSLTNEIDGLNLKLKDYNSELNAAISKLDELKSYQTEEDIGNSKEALQLKQEELAIQKALNDLGFTSKDFDLYPADAIAAVNRELDKYNKKQNTAYKFDADRLDVIKKRKEELRTEAELSQTEKDLGFLERINQEYEAKNDKERDSIANNDELFNKYDETLGKILGEEGFLGLNGKIDDTNDKIEELNNKTVLVLDKFTKSAGQMKLTLDRADKLKQTLDTLKDLDVNVNLNVKENNRSRFSISNFSDNLARLTDTNN